MWCLRRWKFVICFILNIYIVMDIVIYIVIYKIGSMKIACSKEGCVQNKLDKRSLVQLGVNVNTI